MKRFTSLMIVIIAAFFQPGIASATTSTTIGPNHCVVQVASLTGGEVKFTIPEGCTQTVSLASYATPTAVFDPKTADKQKLVDSKTANLTAGTYDWVVKIPECFYQVDFVEGNVITHLDSAHLYGAKIIRTVTGGKACDDSHGATSTTILKPVVTPTSVSFTTTPAPPTKSHGDVPVGDQPVIGTPITLARTGVPYYSFRLVKIACGLLLVGLGLIFRKELLSRFSKNS